MAGLNSSCDDFNSSLPYYKRKIPPISQSPNHDSKRNRPCTPSSVTSDQNYRNIFDSSIFRFPDLFDGDEEIDTSTFRREDLNNLGVYLNEEPLEITDLFNKIKEQNKRFSKNFPDIAKKFVGLTKEVLKFTLNFEELIKSTKGDLTVAKPFVLEGNMFYDLDEAGQHFNVFYREESKKAMTDEIYNMLFQRWAVSALDFIKFTKDVTSDMVWNVPEPHEVEDKSVMETHETEKPVFTELFQKFSEIFFLSARQCGRTTQPFKGKLMSCEPDLCCLMRSNTSRGTPTVLKVYQVDRHTHSEHKEAMAGTWIEELISSEKLGQIGIELLCESANSAFSPNVIGIVCVQTEIIFLYLEITPDHLEALHKNRPVDDKRAIINYTKNFDIMKAEDRVQFVDLMFHLGCLQKGDLSRYYLDV